MTDSIKTIAEKAKDRRAIPASFAVLPVEVWPRWCMTP